MPQDDIPLELPDPATAPELFENVLLRRSIAWFIDVTILGFITSAVMLTGLVAGIFTFGLAWMGLIFAVPLSIAFYYAVTLGSDRRATIGMTVMDLVLTPANGRPLDGWHVVIHPLVFWITSWILPPVSLLFALFTPRRQTIQDLVTGTLMVRRSPMERHWAG